MIVYYFNLRRITLLSGVVLLNVLMVWLSKSQLLNEIVFYNTFSEQLSWDRAMELYGKYMTFSWTAYLVAPILLLAKFLIVTMVLYIGIIYYGLQKEISMGEVFKVVIGSELVFITASMTKLLWFIFFAGNYTLIEMNFFYPLSLANLFSPEEISSYWIYPLQTMNFFQIAYVFMMIAGLTSVSGIGRKNAERVVIMSYGPSLLIWIMLVMFLTINMEQ